MARLTAKLGFGGRLRSVEHSALANLVEWNLHRRNFRQFDNGKLVAGRWKLNQRLGAGGFGDVYKGVDVYGGEVAIKMEDAKQESISLPHEVRMYKMLRSGSSELIGIPAIKFSGQYDGNNILVMDCLGTSLEACMSKAGGTLSAKSVLMIGIQALRALEFVHGCDVVHCDIKPENLMMGRDDAHLVYMVDFGLATRFRDAATGNHVKEGESGDRCGTPDYMSINMMEGKTASRRDDLEGLVYTMVMLVNGRLPWSCVVADDYEDEMGLICALKEGTSAEELCEGMPWEMEEFVRYVERLGFDEKPDYAGVRRSLYRALVEAYEIEELTFDWMPSDRQAAVATFEPDA